MSELDPRLLRAFDRQLERRAEALSAGAERVGWKLGVGGRERIGDGPVVGYLTSASRLESEQSYAADGTAALYADAEVALELDEHGRSAGYAPALEIVDLEGSDDAEEIVADNVFHRAVAFGAFRSDWTGGEGSLLVDDRVRDAAPAAAGYERLVARLAELLGAAGEGIEPGDMLITGSIVQVPVAAGDHVAADASR